jgi:hypothetical protein
MRKIYVKVKTSSRKEGIERVDESTFQVSVNLPPVEGKANARVRELISNYLKIPKTSVELLRGEKSKNKVFTIYA